MNHQTRIVSIFKRHTKLEYKKYGLPKSHHALIYGLIKSAKHRQHVTLTPGKMMARNDTSIDPKKQERYVLWVP